MADINNIPTPKMEMPPELKKLVEEVKSINEAAKKAEKEKKPSVDAKYIVEKFHKDMHGFEHAYAYLTEKLADKLIEGFAGNIAELLHIVDLNREGNEQLFNIDQTLLHLRRDFMDLSTVITSNTKDTSGRVIKAITEASRIEKWKELNNLAQERRDRYEKMRAEQSDDKLQDKRFDDRKKKALENIEEKEPTGIISLIGKILNIGKIKSLAGLLGGFALTWGRWSMVGLKLLKFVGPGAILVALAWEFMNSTFMDMYKAYRGKGNTVAVSLVKAIGDQIQDLIYTALKAFGVNVENEEAKTQVRRQETIIKGKIEELRKKIEESVPSLQDQEDILERYEEFLREKNELDKSIKIVQEKTSKTRRSWIFITRQEIEDTRKLIPQLDEAIKNFNEKYSIELHELNSNIYSVQQQLLKLYTKKELTADDKLEKAKLEEQLNILKEREKNILSTKKELEQYKRAAQTRLFNAFFTYEGLVETVKAIWKGYTDFDEQARLRMLQKEQRFRKYKEEHDGRTPLQHSWFKITNWLEEWFITKPTSWVNGIVEWWKTGVSNFKSNMEAFKLKIEETLSLGQVLINYITDIKSVITDYLTTWIEAVKKKITGWYSNKDKKENPLSKDLMPRANDSYLLEKQSFVAPQPNEPNTNTQLLKAINGLVKQTEKIQLSNMIQTKSTVVSSSNNNATNISAPTTVIASIPPLNVPWSNFNDYGSFKVGYGI